MGRISRCLCAPVGCVVSGFTALSKLTEGLCDSCVRIHTAVIRDVVFVCQRPKEDRLKLFLYKRSKAAGKY